MRTPVAAIEQWLAQARFAAVDPIGPAAWEMAERVFGGPIPDPAAPPLLFRSQVLLSEDGHLMYQLFVAREVAGMRELLTLMKDEVAPIICEIGEVDGEQTLVLTASIAHFAHLQAEEADEELRLIELVIDAALILLLDLDFAGTAVRNGALMLNSDSFPWQQQMTATPASGWVAAWLLSHGTLTSVGDQYAMGAVHLRGRQMGCVAQLLSGGVRLTVRIGERPDAQVYNRIMARSGRGLTCTADAHGVVTLSVDVPVEREAHIATGLTRAAKRLTEEIGFLQANRAVASWLSTQIS